MFVFKQLFTSFKACSSIGTKICENPKEKQDKTQLNFFLPRDKKGGKISAEPKNSFKFVCTLLGDISQY